MSIADDVRAAHHAHVDALTDGDLRHVVPVRSNCRCTHHLSGAAKCNHAGTCCVPDPPEGT